MAQEYKRVLVAIDGSKGADAALRTAIEVTKRNDHTHLDVLRVLDLNSLEYGGAGIALDGQKIYEIEQANEDYMLKLKDKIVAEYNLDADRVSVHLRFGNPKAVITQDFQPEYGLSLIHI